MDRLSNAVLGSSLSRPLQPDELLREFLVDVRALADRLNLITIEED